MFNKKIYVPLIAGALYIAPGYSCETNLYVRDLDLASSAVTDCFSLSQQQESVVRDFTRQVRDATITFDVGQMRDAGTSGFVTGRHSGFFDVDTSRGFVDVPQIYDQAIGSSDFASRVILGTHERISAAGFEDGNYQNSIPMFLGASDETSRDFMFNQVQLDTIQGDGAPVNFHPQFSTGVDGGGDEDAIKLMLFAWQGALDNNIDTSVLANVAIYFVLSIDPALEQAEPFRHELKKQVGVDGDNGEEGEEEEVEYLSILIPQSERENIFNPTNEEEVKQGFIEIIQREMMQ